uniref:Uncharacterized protein n=1 Tax=Fagus sylvatica TaxID=28930 RepID=A0A2N9HVA7_FAGSY
MVRTGKTSCAKVVRRRAVVGNFPAFWLIFVIFPASVNPAPDVGFGKTWYFRKDCDVYFPMAQILYQSKFRLRNSRLQNKGNRRDFLVGSLFFGVDSGQLGDAFDEPKEPASRGITVWESEEYHCFRKVMTVTTLENVGCHYFGRREGCHNLRKHEGYHCIGRREGYHVFGKVRGITSLGDVGVSRLWESVWYHCLGRHEGYHSLGKVRGYMALSGGCMACMALSGGCMYLTLLAFGGGAWFFLDGYMACMALCGFTWLGMALRFQCRILGSGLTPLQGPRIGTYAYMRPETLMGSGLTPLRCSRIGTYANTRLRNINGGVGSYTSAMLRNILSSLVGPSIIPEIVGPLVWTFESYLDDGGILLVFDLCCNFSDHGKIAPVWDALIERYICSSIASFSVSGLPSNSSASVSNVHGERMPI